MNQPDVLDTVIPWVSTEVECMNCGKQWVAVRPLGTTLECPDCESREVDPDIGKYGDMEDRS